MAKLTILPVCEESDVEYRTLSLLHEGDTSRISNLDWGENGNNAWITGYNAKTNNIIIVWRSTNGFQNWMTNFNTRLTLLDVPYALPGTKLHSGFYTDVVNSNSIIAKQIELLLDMYPTAGVEFSGHSSGGAYSTISSFLAANPGGFLYNRVPPSRISIVTFGAPKVGNTVFKYQFDKMGWKQSYRVVKSNDPASYMPINEDYAHVNTEVYIHGKYGYPDMPPVFCDQQKPSEIKGACDNRESFLEVTANPTRFRDIHLSYLGLTLGTIQCSSRVI